MPYCSVLECKNDSRRVNLKNGGVSYHRFPSDASIKEKWINATGRVNWMPTTSSTICSEHFLEVDFVISNKGYRFTKPTALPSKKIVKFFYEDDNDVNKQQGDIEDSQAGSSFADSSAQRSTHWSHKTKEQGKNRADESVQYIRLDIISDGAKLRGKFDAYDKFSLLLAKKIKSIQSIVARMRLMNAIQDLVENACAGNKHDSIDCSAYRTMSVSIVDGEIVIGNAVLQPRVPHKPDLPDKVQRPAVTRSVHVQQITIDPTPNNSFQKNTKKTFAKKRKVTKLVEDNPIGKTSSTTALPTEFVSTGVRTQKGHTPTSDVGEPRPHTDMLEIKEEQIQDVQSTSTMPTEDALAGSSNFGIAFSNDPLPLKLEVAGRIWKKFDKW